MKGIFSILLRLFYNIKGKLILKPIIKKAILAGEDNFPIEYFYYDNAEDGFNGNKRGWYDGYLGLTVSELTLKEQIKHAYTWCANRNPCWNMRYHPKASLDLTKLKTEWKGSTYKHEYQKGYQWYRCTTGGKYKSTFLLIPVTSKKSIYFRFGWKVYPEFTMENKKLPIYKERSVWTVSFRIKGE
jgi:hypothetical protein